MKEIAQRETEAQTVQSYNSTNEDTVTRHQYLEASGTSQARDAIETKRRHKHYRYKENTCVLMENRET